MQSKAPTTKTLIIKGYGFGCFDCTCFKEKVELVINDVTKHLKPGRVVKMEVVTLREGASRLMRKNKEPARYEAIKIISDRDGSELYAAAVARNQAQRREDKAYAEKQERITESQKAAECKEQELDKAVAEAASWVRKAELDAKKRGLHQSEAITGAFKRYANLKPLIDGDVQSIEDLSAQAAGWLAEQLHGVRSRLPNLLESAFRAMETRRKEGSDLDLREATERWHARRKEIAGLHKRIPALEALIEKNRQAEQDRIAEANEQSRQRAAERAALMAQPAVIAEQQLLATRQVDSETRGRANALAQVFFQRGERLVVEELLDIDGERLITEPARWFVVTEDHIWLVVVHPAENKPRNNVVTPYGGGIGRRIPFDPDMAAELRQLDERTRVHDTADT